MKSALRVETALRHERPARPDTPATGAEGVAFLRRLRKAARDVADRSGRDRHDVYRDMLEELACLGCRADSHGSRLWLIALARSHVTERIRYDREPGRTS